MTHPIATVASLLTLSLIISAGCASSADTSTPHEAEKGVMDKPDPAMQKVLDKLATLGGKPIETLSPEEARKQPSPADAVKALLTERDGKFTPEPVGAIKDQMIPGAAGEIPVRIYTPRGEGPFPVILYIHGGGFVIATIDTYDSSARALTNAAKAVLLSVEYRKAPEHKFPASHDDVYAAYKWVLANAASINGDAKRGVAVVGESAGGNMATAVCMTAKQKGDPMPVHQGLVYPVAGDDMNTPSYQTYANAKPLNKAMLEWFFKHEMASPNDANDPRLVPLKNPDLSGLPPATIVTAEIDPLASEGRQYADKLKQAGVKVDYRHYKGVVHEFFGMGAVVPKAKDATKFMADGVKKSFK